MVFVGGDFDREGSSPLMMSDVVWFGSGIEDGTGERWFMLVVTVTEKEVILRSGNGGSDGER